MTTLKKTSDISFSLTLFATHIFKALSMPSQPKAARNRPLIEQTGLITYFSEGELTP